jgi:iron complex outermembrane receptor protein
MTFHSNLKHLKLLASLAGALIASLTMGTASAQDKAMESEGIETVTVTANRVAEDAQKVPLTVASIPVELAEKIGIVNGQTLAQAVPGLMMNRQTNGSQVFMRGIGTASTQAGNEPAVAMYVDDVYYGSSAAALGNYTSVSRIEVLKGPQGTLFGRNATGGVVQVFTKDPSEDAKLDLTLNYGNYNTLGGALYATGSLMDNVTANLSLYSEKQHDGWGDNLNLLIPTYRQHNHGGRAKLNWKVGDKTTILFAADYDDYFNQQAVYFRPTPGTYTAAATGGSTARLPWTTSLADAGNRPVPSLSVPPSGRYDTNEALDPIASVKMYGGSAKITHEFDTLTLKSITAYRNTKSVQSFEQDGASIYRQNPLLQYKTNTWSEEIQLIGSSQAKFQWQAGVFLLKDESIVDPFTFRGIGAGGTAPLFLTALGLNSTQNLDSYAGYFQSKFSLNDKAHLTTGVRYTNDKREIFGGRINTRADGTQTPYVPAFNDGKSKSWSSVTGRFAFDYQFTDDIMAYVAYNKGFKAGLFNSILAPGAAAAAVTPQPNCDGQAVPAVQPGNLAPACHDDPVDPEKISAYSIGLKSQFLDDKLRINVEGFYYKYDGLQLQAVVIVPLPTGGTLTTTRLTNAAKATVKGIDFEAIYKPMKNLTFNLGVSLLEGRYDDFPDGQFFITNPVGGNCAFSYVDRTVAANAAVPIPCSIRTSADPNPALRTVLAVPPNYNPATGHWNLKGNHIQQAPPFSGNLTTTYTVPLSSGGELNFSVLFSHNGNYWAESSNGQGQVNTTTLIDPYARFANPASTALCSFCVNSNPLNEKQQSVDLVNATIQWNSADDKYSLRLWGKNLTDEEYWSFNNSTATVTKQVPAPPRTYGITFLAHF